MTKGKCRRGTQKLTVTKTSACVGDANKPPESIDCATPARKDGEGIWSKMGTFLSGVEEFSDRILREASTGQFIYNVFANIGWLPENAEDFNPDWWIDPWQFESVSIGSEWQADKYCANLVFDTSTGTGISMVQLSGDGISPTYINGTPYYFDSSGNYVAGLQLTAQKSPPIKHPNGSTEWVYKISYTVSAVNHGVKYNLEIFVDDQIIYDYDSDVEVPKGDVDTKTGSRMIIFPSTHNYTHVALNIKEGSDQFTNLVDKKLKVDIVGSNTHSDLSEYYEKIGELPIIPELWYLDVSSEEEASETSSEEEELEEAKETQNQEFEPP